MDHEVGPWKMVFFHGPISFKKKIAKPLGPSIYRCKLNNEPRGMIMHQKMNVLIFLKICPEMVILKRKEKV